MKIAPHMHDPHGDQTSPQHADPHVFLVWFSLERHRVHVDRSVVVTRVGGGGKFRRGLLEKSLTIHSMKTILWGSFEIPPLNVNSHAIFQASNLAAVASLHSMMQNDPAYLI